MIAATLLLAITSLGAPQAAETLITHDFETGLYGWKTLSEAHTIELTSNALDVKSGKSALAFSYVPSEGQIPAMLLEVGDLTGAGGVSFWVKSSRGTSLVISIGEKDETPGAGAERYGLIVTIPRNAWTEIKANIEDFALADDTPAINGVLDLENTGAIAIVDFLGLFAIGETAAFLFGSRDGTNAVWLDDFKVLKKPPMPKLTRQKYLVDSFDRDYVSWIPLRGISLTIARGKGMTVSYEREPGRLYGLFRAVSPNSLAGAREIVFVLKCPQETEFIARVEESDGEKWQMIVSAPGGNETSEVVTPLTEFGKADDSGNADGKLSSELITSVALVDMTEAATGTKNEFVIEKVFAR